MERVNHWELLDTDQQAAVIQESKRISNKLILPASYSSIVRELQASGLKNNNGKGEPIAIALKLKLLQYNRKAIFKLFDGLRDMLFEKILRSIKQYYQEMTIKYLSKEYIMIVNQLCKTQDFEWRIIVPKSRCLWDRLHTQVRRLLKATLSFMKKKFQFKALPSEKLLQKAMLRFNDVFEELKPELEQSFNLNETVADTLIELGKAQRDEMQKKDAELAKLIHEMQMAQKDQEQKQKQHTFLSKIKNAVSDKFSGYFSSNVQNCKSFKECEGYSKNVDNYFKLSKKQLDLIESISFESKSQLYDSIKGKFSKQETNKLIFSLRQPGIKWIENEHYLVGQQSLPQDNRNKIAKWKNDFIQVVKTLQGIFVKDNTKYIRLAKLFYLLLEEDYSPLPKKYLNKVCQSIEKNSPCRIYLRGALKIFQQSTLNASRLSLRFQEKLPLRSKKFNQTEKSRFCRQSYGSPKQINLEKSYSSEHIKLERLTYAKPSKNVIFLVSGFLSEDTQKDIEWQGAIRALEDSQMYGVVWRSSSFTELGKYLIKAGAGIAMTLKSGGLGAAIGILTGLASKFIDSNQKDNSNPFWQSLARAKKAGYQLADQLIEHFSDRFITLIGFSMGTEVVQACIERLAEKNQLGIILRIVTLGGIANKQRVYNMLSECSQPLSWINFKSNNDLTVRYIYRVCTLGSQPIGSAGVKPVAGHEVENWQLEELVSGHFDFRNHMRGLCLMAGLRHD